MTPSKGIANALAALAGPPATPEQIAAHMAACAAVRAADERAREPSPQLEMEVAPNA